MTKSYHLTQEQIAKLLEEKGYYGEWFKLVPRMTEIVNAALDQVLGEPVAEVVNLNNQYEAPVGVPFFDDGRWSLKVGQKLYTPKE